MPLRTGPMGPCELRYNGVLGNSGCYTQRRTLRL
jgi:hypothetical protein